MQIDFHYRPIPVHTPFHQSTAYERAMFGAVGSGKTYAICSEAIAWCLEQPGIRGLITRKTIPELRDTTETVFFDILPYELRQAGHIRRMGGHISDFTFPNGSKVLFRSIDDWEKHKSLNVGFIAWDEADEFDLETYRGMSTRVRQKDPTTEALQQGAGPITRRGMWLATNPAGHNWLYKRFIDKGSDDYQAASDYFTSTSFDNPYLSPDYMDSLMSLPDAWVRRYVLCQFDDFGGQIYEEWGWDTHVIPARSLAGNTFSRGQMFWMGMDPGMRSPTAGLWVWLNPETREMIAVREYEETNVAAPAHAREWRRIEAELKGTVKWRVADPAIMRRDLGTNMSLHSQYQRLGYNFQLGPKQHGQRIPALGQLIHLGRFKITDACPLTYEAVKQYKWADLSPAAKAKGADAPEKPFKHNDHLVDCAQYLSSRWIKPPKSLVRSREPDLNDEIRATIKKQMRRKREAKGTSHDLGGLPL